MAAAAAQPPRAGRSWLRFPRREDSTFLILSSANQSLNSSSSALHSVSAFAPALTLSLSLSLSLSLDRLDDTAGFYSI